MKEAPLLIHIPWIPHEYSYIIYTWLIMVMLFAIAYIVSRGVKPMPEGIQNFFEMVVDGIMKFMEDIIGRHSRQYLSLIGTLTFFIVFSNLLGLIPGFMSPTSNINTTAACAIIVFFATHYYGVKAHGIGYIKHFFGPIRSIPAIPLMLLMLILEIIGHFARILSLSLRLFGNIYGEDLILLILVSLVPILVPLPIMFIAVFTSVVQTFVFVLLTMIYIKLATEEAEEGH